MLAQPFHEELWSEGPGARPLLGASYEQVKQTKHTGKKGGWARPEVRWPDLCPFQMKCGSSSNRSRVADRVLVLQLGVRPLRWESQVQDIGPPETSQTHVISISKSSQRDLHLNAKTQRHSMTVLDTLCQTTSKTGTQPHVLAKKLPKIIISTQTPQNTLPDVDLPTRKTRSSLIHQNTGTSPLYQEACTTH